MRKIKRMGRLRDKDAKNSVENPEAFEQAATINGVSSGSTGNVEVYDSVKKQMVNEPPRARTDTKSALFGSEDNNSSTSRREGSLADEKLDEKSAQDEKQDNEVVEIQKEILATLKLTQTGLGINSKGQIDEDNKESLAGLTAMTAAATSYTAENGGGGGGDGDGGIVGDIADTVTDKLTDKAMNKIGGKFFKKGGKKLLSKAGKGVAVKAEKAAAKSAAKAAEKAALKAGEKAALKAGSKAALGLGEKAALAAGGEAALKLGGGAALKAGSGVALKAGTGMGLKAGLAGAAKFAGPVGIALAALQAGYGGVKGWQNASNIAGLDYGQKATTGQKFGAAASGAASELLTFGLVKPETIYKGGKNFGNALMGDKLDKNGNLVKRSAAEKALRLSLLASPAGPWLLAKMALDEKKNKKILAEKAKREEQAQASSVKANGMPNTASNPYMSMADDVSKGNSASSSAIAKAGEAGAMAIAAGKVSGAPALDPSRIVVKEGSKKAAAVNSSPMDSQEREKQKLDAMAGSVLTSKELQAAKAKEANKPSTTAGATVKTAVKVKESPYLTNDKEFTKTITNLLQVQKELKDEMVRHHEAAEDFYETVKSILNGMVGREVKRDDHNKKKEKEQKDGNFFSNLFGGNKDGSQDQGAQLDAARSSMMASLNSNANTLATGN
jgi:hypothetical protein